MKHILDVYDEENDIFKTKSGIKPNCKWTYLKLHYNKKDDLQKQIIEDNYIGCTKITRLYKKGNWRYFVQINFEHLSPVIDNMKFENHKVAINVNTEMVAVVRDDGTQEIIERTPTTPRVTDEINEINVFMDNSKRSMNPDLFKEDGQIKYNKKQMKELDLHWNYSKNYIKQRKKRKELYRLLTAERRRNNEILAKSILQTGNSFIIDRNQFKAWQMKLNRMSKGSQNKFDNGIRKANDYADQIQNTAPGMFTERIKSVCNQLQLPLLELKTFNSSNYNHFTQQNDLFIELNKRFLTFANNDTYKDDKVYNETALQFINTLGVIEHNKKRYILQRDLYGASKMLFISRGTEKALTKSGKEYNREVDVFDQKTYSKWFDKVFYPKHLEYMKEFIKKYNLNIDLNDFTHPSK